MRASFDRSNDGIDVYEVHMKVCENIGKVSSKPGKISWKRKSELYEEGERRRQLISLS